MRWAMSWFPSFLFTFLYQLVCFIALPGEGEREVGVGITNLSWRFFPSFSVTTCTFLTVFFLITQIKSLGAKAGVVLNPGTPLTAIEYVLDGEFISRSIFSFIIYLFLCNMLIQKVFNDVTEGPYLIWPICWSSFLIPICYLLTTKVRCGHMSSLAYGLLNKSGTIN